MIDLEFHPIADIFPMMADNELQDLAKDIGKNGLREAIWIDDQNRIVDGRNRYRACGIAGVDPTLRQYQESEHGALVAFVVSLNLKRRHLTENQRGMVAAKIANLEAHQFAGNQYVSHGPIGPQQITNADAAKLMNVGERSVKRARAVLRSGDSETIARVEKGEMTLTAAEQKVRGGSRSSKSRKPKSETPMPEPRVRVIYDSEDQVAEQICTLCNRLAEVAEKVSPEGIWPKIAGNVRFANNIDRSLSAAAHFLGDLHLMWARASKKDAAG